MLRLLAGPWYKDGTVLNYISIGVAIFLGAIAVWSQFASGKFRRSRLVWEASAYWMLGAYSPSAKRLTINYDGTPVTNPRLLVLKVTLEGRKDIPSDAFDRGRQLAFDVGATILEIVEVEWPGLDKPVVTASGTRILIGPELIPASKGIEVSAVVDGDTKMECVLQPIKDVTLRERAVRVSTVPDVFGLLLASSWGLYQASAAHWEGSAVLALMLLSFVVLFIGIGRLREAVLRLLEDRKDRT